MTASTLKCSLRKESLLTLRFHDLYFLLALLQETGRRMSPQNIQQGQASHRNEGTRLEIPERAIIALETHSRIPAGEEEGFRCGRSSRLHQRRARS